MRPGCGKKRGSEYKGRRRGDTMKRMTRGTARSHGHHNESRPFKAADRSGTLQR